MKNNNYIYKKTKKEIKKIERIIEYRNLSNIKNLIISSVLKTGLVIDYSIPFFLVGIILFNVFSEKGITPFKRDINLQKASVKTIDTSSGYHIEKISYEEKYKDEILEYSTGWRKNEYNKYERIVTTYMLNYKVDINNIEDIFKYTKEELEEMLIVTNLYKVERDFLLEEDKIYNEEAIIVTNHYTSDNEMKLMKEHQNSNIVSTLLYIILLLYLGKKTKIILKKVIHINLNDKLKYYINKYKIIKDDDIFNLLKLLKVKKDNLLLMEENDNDNNKTYKLRKR